MSASKPREQAAQNPATKFIKWKGDDDSGYFYYYDKEIKKNMIVNLEKFIIVDEDLMSVSGYDEPNAMGIQSNEVRSMKSPLRIMGYKSAQGKDTKPKPTVLYQGTLADMKLAGDMPAGAKIFKNMYILVAGELCHLSLGGAAFSKWIEMAKANRGYGGRYISHHETGDGKKGAVKYKFPLFTSLDEVEAKEWEEVIRIDSEVVQPYLEEYFKRGTTQEESHPGGESKSKVDTSGWRNIASPSGVRLGTYDQASLMELEEMLIDKGQHESDMYSYVAQGLYDYQEIAKTYATKVDTKGRLLSDYSKEELLNILPKTNEINPIRQLLYYAIDKLNDAGIEFGDEEEEDDIPF